MKNITVKSLARVALLSALIGGVSQAHAFNNPDIKTVYGVGAQAGSANNGAGKVANFNVASYAVYGALAITGTTGSPTVTSIATPYDAFSSVFQPAWAANGDWLGNIYYVSCPWYGGVRGQVTVS